MIGFIAVTPTIMAQALGVTDEVSNILGGTSLLLWWAWLWKPKLESQLSPGSGLLKARQAPGQELLMREVFMSKDIEAKADYRNSSQCHV